MPLLQPVTCKAMVTLNLKPHMFFPLLQVMGDSKLNDCKVYTCM